MIVETMLADLVVKYISGEGIEEYSGGFDDGMLG
jgi:hypothetical protein